MTHSQSLDLEAALAGLKRALNGALGPRVVSMMLYGSAVLGDLAPGYGDIDFLAVIDGDLSDEDCRRLVEVRRTLRGADSGVFARMLEGAFLPRPMLDPAVKGRAFWWGTSGERPWSANQLGAFVLCVIRDRGTVIHGADVRAEVPPQSDAALLADIRNFCESARLYGTPGTLHSIDWLLTSARLLLWLNERRFSSKSEAADWAVEHALGAWRLALPKAKYLRLNPSHADERGWREWLNLLAPLIQQARQEVETAIVMTHAGERG